MAKTKYFITDPNGVEHTRTTARTYTNTVAIPAQVRG